MSDFLSVFVVLSSCIIEICFSRNNLNDSQDSNKRMNASQFLLVSATQFILRVSELKSHWKKWLFFVLTTAIGEGFRIDSCRDYPRELFTGINIEKFTVNEFDLIVNIQNQICSVRIDPIVQKNFLAIMENKNSEFLKQKIASHSLPFNEEYQKGKIRTLDLKLIMKRTTLSTPSLDQVQTWIITWNPITEDEFKRLAEKTVNIENIDIMELPPFLSIEEVTEKGWNDHREASLEQPWGLLCPKCKMTYEANIFAKTCYSCQTLLRRA